VSRQDDGLPATLDLYLKHLATKFDDADKSYRRIRYETWAQIELYWRGQQFMGCNPNTGVIESLPMDENDIDLYFVNNIMLPFIEQLAAEAARSNPKLTAYSDAGEHRRIVGALESAQHWIDCAKQGLWSAEELQRENKLVLFRSVAFTRTWFDELDQKIKSDGIDPLQVRISDRAATIKQSPFLTFEQIAWKFDIQERYELDKVPAGSSTMSAAVDGLGFKRQLEIALGSTGEPDSSMNYYRAYDPKNLTDDMTCRESMRYLDLRVYRNYIVRKGEKIPGTQQRLGSDTKMGEIFPSGLKEVRVNNELVATFDLDKNAEWDSYKFMVPGAGFYGVGMENILPQQDWFNEFVSIITTAAVYAGAGVTAIDTSKVKNGGVLNKPGSFLAFDDLAPGEKVGDSIAHYNTAGLDQALLGMPGMVKENMQFVSGARNSQVSGLPGKGIETATGNNNAKGTADSFSSKSLVLRAWNLARRMEQGLALFQKHQVYPQYYQRFGDTQGKWLRAADIGVDIKVRPEEDTEQPRTNLDMRNDTMAAIQAGYGNPQVAPPLQQHLGRIFHMPATLDKADAWATIAQKRIDKMQEAVGLAEGMMQERQVPPEQAQPFVVQQVAQTAAPQPRDDHGAILAAYSDFLISDWFEEAADSFKAALYEVMDAHEQAGQQKQMADAERMKAMAADPEAPDDGSGEREQAKMEQVAQLEAAKMEQQAGDKESERTHRSEEAEAQRAHESDKHGAQLATQIELARIKEKGDREKLKAQVQIAKSRPKPTNTKK
jgi:hypothetical protein